jgi:KH domain
MPSESSPVRDRSSQSMLHLQRPPHTNTLFPPVFFSSASPARSRSGSPSPHDTLTLRALVSTKEAGIIIGKGGKNVADLREQTGVKAGVSKVIQGVHERVLTVTGPVEGVSKVRSQFSTPLSLQPHLFFITPNFRPTPLLFRSS